MKRIWWTRAGLFVFLFLLCLWGIKNPIYKTFDIDEYEDQKIPLYFTEIIEEMGSSYLVSKGLPPERNFPRVTVIVIAQHSFQVGDIVSFYGIVKSNVLIAEKYKVHKYPNYPYFISTPVIILFPMVLLRSWKVNFRDLCLLRRKRGA
jgi:hypothetical protein